ncbi:PhzF family phenazine biosynthesis protein [Enterococcus faecium]|uniref:PhzF family phenazine biosynthesis protein n=1 Tax=Enterococcus faecium TaxID=1352 RepID=UPI0029536062|nr:PhzF family phenazine biosynthesis protein [Enterococcus faecium]MDV7727795.1 PhzF family phenazine biosynthesis protein [Enterococcus faecium]
MNLDYYVVDAFADEVFKGNPAAVYVLEEWLPESTMQKIAIENNLSETAFVLFNYYKIPDETIKFSTQSGNLFVTRIKDYYYMDFPSIMPKKVPILTEYEEAIGAKIKEAYLARDLFFVLEDEKTVAKLQPDFTAIKNFELGIGVIVTAESVQKDFVSRTFFPKLTINEDPVCGSAHSNLIPYWAERMNKTKLSAYQMSSRGGDLECELKEDRVIIGGKAVLFSKGTSFI